MKIEINNITKKFKNKIALDNVSMCFEENKIYGLLGKNGAGKSTLLNIMTDRLIPTTGEVTMDGKTVHNNDILLHNMYLMSEKNFYPPEMKIKDVFKWTERFYGKFDRAMAGKLIKAFALDVKLKVRELSTGYSSIFKIIIALSLDIPFVLLDEPVLGLDANHRDLFYKTLLESYVENPRTFIISTHLIEEIASMVENIIIINEGKVMKNDSCENLLKSGYTISGSCGAVDKFVQGKELIGEDVLGGLKSAYILGQSPSSQDLPSELELSRLNLQKLFIQLTNKKEV